MVPSRKVKKRSAWLAFRSTALFSLLVFVYSTDICRLWVLTATWERCICPDVGHWVCRCHTSQGVQCSIACKVDTFVSTSDARPYAFMCVRTVSTIRYVEWPGVRVTGTVSQWRGKHVASVSDYECLPNEPVVGTVWQFFTWLAAQYIRCLLGQLSNTPLLGRLLEVLLPWASRYRTAR